MTKKVYKFLTMFDCEGFECIIDITKREQDFLIASLKGEEYNSDINLNAMMLRARYNPQRSPEIWVFSSYVERESLLAISEDNPQGLVDLIRSNGSCVWKNYPVKQVIK